MLDLRTTLGRFNPIRMFNNPIGTVKKRDDDEMWAFISIAKSEFEREVLKGNFEIIDNKNIKVRISINNN